MNKTGPYPKDKTIVFFDGVCGLCNRLVDFLLRRDKKDRFLFAPLQGLETMPEILKGSDSILVFDNEKYSIKSAAVFVIVKRLGGVWKLFYIFNVLPTPFCDYFYDHVARRRYQIFGRKDSCRVATAEERRKFLDAKGIQKKPNGDIRDGH